MKRLGTLALAILLITGCNAMKPNMAETELLWRETEKNIQKWVETVEDTAKPTEASLAKQPKATEALQKPPVPTLTEEPTPKPLMATSTPEPDKPAQATTGQPEQSRPAQAEHPEEKTDIIDWPYITCPPEPERPQITAPEPPATQEWPYITAPEPPTYTPEPTEPPQEQPAPTPQPVPIVPIPESTAQSVAPDPEQPAEQPSGSYAECSCGARLTPEEVFPHMKAHALNGENHSYRAY